MEARELQEIQDAAAPLFVDDETRAELRDWREHCVGDTDHYTRSLDASIGTTKNKTLDIAAATSGFLTAEAAERDADKFIEHAKHAGDQAAAAHRALNDAAAVGEVVAGRAAESPRLKPWDQPEVEPSDGTRVRGLGILRGARRRRKDRADVSTAEFLGQADTEPIDFFESTLRVALQHDQAVDALLTDVAMINLVSLEPYARQQLGVTTAFKGWEHQLLGMRSATDEFSLALARKRLTASIMDKLWFVVEHGEEFVDELTLYRMEDVTVAYDSVQRRFEDRKQQLADLTHELDMPQAGKLSRLLTFESRHAKAQQAETAAQAENTTNVDQDLHKEAAAWPGLHAELLSGWRLSRDFIKTNGLADLGHRLVNPGEIQGRRPPGFDKDTARLILSLLWQANDTSDADAFRAALRDSLQAEHEGLALYRSVVAELRDSQTPLDEQAFVLTLRGTLDTLVRDWRDVEAIASEAWPKGVPFDMAKVKRLLLEVEALEDQANEAPADTEALHEKTELIPMLEGAKQLDWEVLPPGDKLEVLRQEITKNYPPEQVDRIEWYRLEDLVAWQELFGGEIYRSKHYALGTREPYFVLFFEIDDLKFGIAECPQYRNSTYLVREDLTPGTRKEVLELRKPQARGVGAVRVNHTDPPRQREKVVDRVQSLASIAA